MWLIVGRGRRQILFKIVWHHLWTVPKVKIWKWLWRYPVQIPILKSFNKIFLLWFTDLQRWKMAYNWVGNVQELRRPVHRQREGRDEEDPWLLHWTLLHDRRRHLWNKRLHRLHAAHHHRRQLQAARRLEGRGVLVNRWHCTGILPRVWPVYSQSLRAWRNLQANIWGVLLWMWKYWVRTSINKTYTGLSTFQNHFNKEGKGQQQLYRKYFEYKCWCICNQN